MRILPFIACLTTLLAGCAATTPPSTVAMTPPAQWYAPLPHQGDVRDLSRWWRQHGDILLVELIDSAQAVSPTIASAGARIEQARAVRVAAGAALAPTIDASLSAQRGRTQPPTPLGSIAQGGVQAAWEIDLFGGIRASRDAAQARLEGAQAGWHDARVSVAAEVANLYYSLRNCEQLLAITSSDAASRAETARLSQLSANAGFQAPANAALARASAAEGSARVTLQRTLCELDVKSLVALTAIAEPELRKKLADNSAAWPSNLSLTIDTLPAQILLQRPDVFSAEREVAATSADTGSAQAQRYPRLSLAGSIGAGKVRSGDISADLSIWSIGPLSLNVPLFDGGRRAANVDAAQARYDDAVTSYRSAVRQAVREVENALVALQSTGARSVDAVTAVEGYRASFLAAEARYQSGLGSLIELEEVRRVRLTSELALASLERERVAAWIALYRAAGGGWTADTVARR